jgi:hypothetical protein
MSPVADAVPDHLDGDFHSLSFGGLMVGAHLAMLIAMDAATVFNVEMEPEHFIDAYGARPVPSVPDTGEFAVSRYLLRKLLAFFTHETWLAAFGLGGSTTHSLSQMDAASRSMMT